MTNTRSASVEQILNQSFDQNTQKLQVEALAYDPVNQTPTPMQQPATGFTINGYDYFNVSSVDSTTDLITYKKGGASGSTLATLTVVYTDTSKDTVQTITKS